MKKKAEVISNLNNSAKLMLDNLNSVGLAQINGLKPDKPTNGETSTIAFVLEQAIKDYEECFPTIIPVE